MDLTQRLKISSGGPYEDLLGYSRVLVTGPFAYVAGTTASTKEGVDISSSCAEQTQSIMEVIREKLAEARFDLEDIVRVRMFVVDIKRDWDEISRAMSGYFKDIKPVMTMVEVSKLVDDRLLIEIEVDAVKRQSLTAQ